MINYNKNSEGMVYVPRFEYNELITLKAQKRYLEKRIKQIRIDNIEDKKKGFDLEPKMYVEELEAIFDLEDITTLPFEITDDDIDKLTQKDLEAAFDTGYQE